MNLCRKDSKKRFTPVRLGGHETNKDSVKGAKTHKSEECTEQRSESRVDHEKPNRGYIPIRFGRHEMFSTNMKNSSEMSVELRSKKRDSSNQRFPIRVRKPVANEHSMSLKKTQSTGDINKNEFSKYEFRNRGIYPSQLAKLYCHRQKKGVKGNVAKYIKDCYSGRAAEELMFAEGVNRKTQSDTILLKDIRSSKRLILQNKNQAKNYAEERVARDPLNRKRGILRGENVMQRTQNNFRFTMERLFNA